MTLESILGIALPVIGGIANTILSDNKPAVVEKVEVVKENTTPAPVHPQNVVNPLFTPVQQPPVTVNFNLNIYINGKKPGEGIGHNSVTIDV